MVDAKCVCQSSLGVPLCILRRLSCLDRETFWETNGQLFRMPSHLFCIRLNLAIPCVFPEKPATGSSTGVIPKQKQRFNLILQIQNEKLLWHLF